MDRLISEQAIVDVLSKGYWDKSLQSAKGDPCVIDAMIDWAIRQVKAIPSTDKWIPVSEKLPDKDKYNRGSVWERSVLVTAYFKWDDAKHTFIGMRLAEDVINNNFIDECIIAWMPLPEPFAPQERSDRNLKMWEEIYAEEKRREGSDKE